MHYTFLVQLLQEYPTTDFQFQKLLFQSSDSSSLWIRVLRAADQSLTNIPFCVGWPRHYSLRTDYSSKKEKIEGTEGWNYISMGLKKCAIKKYAMKRMQGEKDAVGILNLVIVQIFETNFLNIWFKKLCNFRFSSSDLVFFFNFKETLFVRKISRFMSAKLMQPFANRKTCPSFRSATSLSSCPDLHGRYALDSLACRFNDLKIAWVG